MATLTRRRKSSIPLSIIKWLFTNPWGWLTNAVALSIALVIFVFITLVIGITSASIEGNISNNNDFAFGGNLSAETLAWSEDVQNEVNTQGLDDKWVRYILGIIQAESGGNASRTPDIMQSSESLGHGMNHITDPRESIRVGVTALSHAINRAEELEITDTRAILQAYNFNTGFLTAMKSANKTEFDIDFSQEYSRNVVFPAVTGEPAGMATRVPYTNPWSKKVGMPWRWFNGGNFHYPNIIYYYISFVGDGTFILPFDPGSFSVTSEFGPRRHPVTGEINRMHYGIDVQSSRVAGTPIRSIASGEVVQKTYGSSYGNYIVINHGVIGENEFGIDQNKIIYSLYGHMHNASPLSVGSSVEQGDVIGYEGTTGRSTGVHLHLEIMVGSPGQTWNAATKINPREVINFDF